MCISPRKVTEAPPNAVASMVKNLSVFLPTLRVTVKVFWFKAKSKWDYESAARAISVNGHSSLVEEKAPAVDMTVSNRSRTSVVASNVC